MEDPIAKPTRSLSPPPTDRQPDPKKLKMSSTTATSDEDVVTTRTPRYKRRKIAIFFAYCGVGYQGMQKNPGAKTIEGELEEALFHCGAVPEQDRGCPKRYDWARSARTDKGVSAVGQVISGRFYIDPPGFIERLNSNLPSQIRVFGYKRATASFSAKKFCDRRRYVYLVPVFALDSSSHRDRESVAASLGSDSELVKCLECPDRGRKVLGVMGKRGILSNTLDTEVIKSSVEDGNIANSETETETETVGVNSNPKVNDDELNDKVAVDHSVANGENLNSDSPKEIRVLNASKYRYDDEEKERFNRILNSYVGTHNFHNFTARIKAEDPSAKRFIISFNANTTVTVEGIEFVKCEVVGQSFMLHQIRKMIGLAVAIMRKCSPESLIETALKKDVNITVPTAPEVGLYLEECFFSSYNQKWKDTHEEVSMRGYEDEAEDFKLKHIYSHIASTEHKEGTVGLWLHSLNHRNYADLNVNSIFKTPLKSDEDKVDDKEANGDEVEKNKIDTVETNGDASCVKQDTMICD